MKNGYAKTLSLGIQHVLAMYAGAVVVPLIVGAAQRSRPAHKNVN